MDNEVWKDIVDYEGKYQVSNMGRVKSLERVDRLGRLVKEKILSPRKDRYGYLFVNLHANGKHKRYFVHRLVLSTFNPCPDSESLQVNHINECKTDNRLENLEWCTRSYNINHGTRNDRVSEKLSLPIAQLTLGGKFVKAWESSMAAERNGFNSGGIISCCKNKFHREGNNIYKGFKWMYLSEYLDKNCGIID